MSDFKSDLTNTINEFGKNVTEAAAPFLKPIGAGLRAFSNAVTFGQRDRAVAALDAATGRTEKSYGENLEKERATTERAWKDHSVASWVGTAAAAIVPGAAGAKMIAHAPKGYVSGQLTAAETAGAVKAGMTQVEFGTAVGIVAAHDRLTAKPPAGPKP